jgi:hypothetical protein
MIYRNAVRTVITAVVIALGLVVYMGSALANLPMQGLAPDQSVPYTPRSGVTKITILYQRTDPIDSAVLEVDGSPSCTTKQQIEEQDMQQKNFSCESAGKQVTLTNIGEVTLRVGINDINF